MVKRIFAIILFLLLPAVSYGLPAFPGAQGWGSDTIGGRGGTVIKVTNLNDSGSGSLRAALLASGARYIIFTVGGTITLTSPIAIYNPYVTVAGQTAPGGGILIRGPNEQGGNGNATIEVDTHDVIIRGLRIRDTGKAAIEILGESINQTYNVIVDHNSLSWSTDTITGLWGYWHHITWSYNIISEGIFNDTGQDWGLSAGMLVGSGYGCTNYDHLSVHHNMFVHNSDRNPEVNHNTPYFEWINNYSYDWYRYGLELQTPGYVVGNHYETSPVGWPEYYFYLGYLGGPCPFPDASVYLGHNITPNRPTDSGPETDALSYPSVSIQYVTGTPPYSLSGITEDSVTTVKGILTASNGAGAYVPSRDAVDVRVVNDAINHTGTNGWFLRTYNMPSPWPTIATGQWSCPGALCDTDGDGMLDSWESANGTNPGVVDYNGDIDGDGYRNIEEFINSFFLPPGDITPPVRYDSVPGSLPSGTTNYDMTMTTTDDSGGANCRLSTVQYTAYADMTNVFNTTGGATHIEPLAGLADGNCYTYYTRCQDISENLNTNLNDYEISFCVQAAAEQSLGIFDLLGVAQ